MVNRALIEDLLPTAAITSVAHYTRIGTLGHFIPEGTSGWGSAWATPVQFLNDRMELSLGLDVLLRRIIIGPGWQLSRLGSTELSRNHIVQGIDRLLTARGLYNVLIESSTIPYDPK